MQQTKTQITPGTSKEEKDLFICYSSKDKKFVQKLAEDLKTHGVTVWWDEWEMMVGDSINKKIQEGILKSSYLAVVLSPDSVESQWVEKELNAAYIIELEEHKVFILPMLYRTANIPIFLKDRICADFRYSYKEGFFALTKRLIPEIDPQITNALMSENHTKILSAYSKIQSVVKDKYLNFLIEKLSGPSTKDKLASIMALFVIRYKNLSHHLMMMAKEPSIAVRRRAIFYLGELRHKDALPLILSLMSDSPDVRATARDAYKKITGKRFMDQ